MRYSITLRILVVLMLTQGVVARAEAPGAIAGTSVETGLCIVLPAVSGKELGALSHDGRFVVQGLCSSDQLDAVRGDIPEKMSGLVSAQGWQKDAKLPYADHLVNLLVIDRDALGAAGPTDAEVLRVIAPATGAVWQKKAGAWSKLTKPMPKEYGEWTHYYGDATNNPVSKDTAVKVPTGLQWIAESPLRQSSENQLAEGGRYLGGFGDSGGFKGYMSVRGAFNGIEQWRRKMPPRAGRLQRFGPLAMGDGLVYTFRTPEKGPLIALDSGTGDEVKVFDLALPDVKKTAQTRYLHPGHIAVFEQYLLVSRVDKLFCLDRKSGALRWTFDGDGKNVAFPTVDPVNQRVGLLIAADGNTYMDANRQTQFPLAEIVSINLQDGKPVWRIPHPMSEFSGNAAFVWANGAFYLHRSKGLGPGGISLGAIDAATGKPLWLKPNIERWAGAKGHPGIGTGSLLVYPDAVVLTRSAVLLVDPKDGTVFGDWAVGNSRCDNGRGDAGGFSNFGHYFRIEGKELTTTRNEVARNPCGGANLPVYGMHYFQPQMCQCFAAVRGLMAVSSQPVLPPLADGERLERGPAFAVKPAVREQPSDWPALLHDSTRSAGGSALKNAAPKELWRVRLETGDQPGAAANDWRSCANNNGPISAPVVAGGMAVVAAPDAHRIHAVDAATGEKRWTFTAGSRIDTPPTLAGGRVYAGCRDGYVYCLDLATGKLAWRFLAARNRKMIAAYGQVESAWPMGGALVVEKGIVIATAGHHPDIDGGVHCWGLDAATGAVRWQRVVASTRKPVTMNPKINRIDDPDYFDANKFVNSIPSSDGEVVLLPGLQLKLADGAVGRVVLGGAATPNDAEPTWDLMVSDWRVNSPSMRSKDNDFGGPGSPQQRQSYTLSGGKPAAVKNAWGRRWAWDAKRLVNVHLNQTTMLVLDRDSPVSGSVENHKRAEVGKIVDKFGKAIAVITLAGDTVKDSSPYGGGGFDPAAMILAGDQAVVAWARLDKENDIHFRPESTLQLIDLNGGKLTTELAVKPGVIEHGMAAANGRLYLSLEDGSLVAME